MPPSSGVPRSDSAEATVLSVVLLIAVGLLLSFGVFWMGRELLSAGPDEGSKLALASPSAGNDRTAWRVEVQSASRSLALSTYTAQLATPRNGTLVVTTLESLAGAGDFFFQLGPTSGDGPHPDNGTVVAPDGLGGFHLRLLDVNTNQRLDGGDKIVLWYDGNGDQGHTGGPDDFLPAGAYALDLIDRGSASLVGRVTRDL